MYKLTIYLKSGNKIEFVNDTESYEKLAQSIYKEWNELINGIFSLEDKVNFKKYKIPVGNIDYIEVIDDE